MLKSFLFIDDDIDDDDDDDDVEFSVMDEEVVVGVDDRPHEHTASTIGPNA